jgi:chromate reductase, NAD(P)H dehydrogenase (quinone)
MSAQLVPEASIAIPLQGRMLDASGIAADAALSTALKEAIEALAAAIRAERRGRRC